MKTFNRAEYNMKIIEHTEMLAAALRAICDDAPCAKDMRLFPIVEIMPHLITEARAALAAWERHNETTKEAK